MEMKLQLGDYIPGSNGLQEAEGAEAVLQRVLFKLTAHRGGFVIMPELGSNLYKLAKIKPAQRTTAAWQYVLEAISDESGLTVRDIALEENGDKLYVTVNLEYENEDYTVNVKAV